MERFWNYIHYNIYLFEVNATFFFRYILNFIIFNPLSKIKFFKNGLEKKGTSFKEIDEITVKTLNNPEYGKSITIAGIQMGGLLVIIEISLFNFLQAIIGKSLIQYVWEDNFYRWVFIIGSLVLPGIINNALLWKKDKYLIYFKEFKKEPKAKKRKWAWISFGVIVGVTLLFVLSLMVAMEVLHEPK
jgi:hypothetical protein